MTGIMKGWIDEIGPQVAALIRSKPELMDQMLQDPTGFIRRELGVQLPFTAQLYEKDGNFSVAPTGLIAGYESDELNDELLDLVSGGEPSGGGGTFSGPVVPKFE
jgi:hypothetical protein